MASKFFGWTLGAVAVLALAPSFAVQTASAAETELVVIVTPYITHATRQNGPQTSQVLGKRPETNPDSQNQASSDATTLDGAPENSASDRW